MTTCIFLNLNIHCTYLVYVSMFVNVHNSLDTGSVENFLNLPSQFSRLGIWLCMCYMGW